MPRKPGKLKQALMDVEKLEKENKNYKLLVKGMKVKELDWEVKYRQKEVEFASYKLNQAKVTFAEAIGEGNADSNL